MSIGKLEPFKIGEGNWTSYITRMGQYFKVNTIKDEMKTAILITAVGDEVFELMVDLCSPEKPEDQSFAGLVSLLKDHLQPTPSEIAERYKFRQRRQENGESMATYIATLKKLSKNCNFGSNLETQLRDQLVFGLRNDAVRQRLFQEKRLTYKTAHDISINMEAAEINSGLIAPEGNVQHVSRTQKTAASVPGKSTYFSRNEAGGSRCRHCGKTNHYSQICFFKDAMCNICKKKGHISSVCSQHKGKNFKFNKFVDVTENKANSDDSEEELNFFNITHNSEKPLKIKLKVENVSILMEIDTGSPISAISDEFYVNYFKNVNLNSSKLNLKSYAGDLLNTLGFIYVGVTHENIVLKLKLFVVKNGGPPIIGRDWIRNLNISVDNLLNINQLTQVQITETLKSKFPEVFAEGLGKFNKGLATLHLKNNTMPVFCKARNLALALKEKVEKELVNLVELNILTPVEFSDWATPIVPVLKKTGEVRICGDYKITLNPKLLVDNYPIPKIEHLFAKLNKGQYFSKLDLSQAYAQIELTDESKALTVLNTHKGLFQMNRLPYGVASSPGIFQRIIESIFAGMNNVAIFLDDILITGKNSKEHLENLFNVFGKLRDCGLRIKISKCSFFQEEINFLGYTINKFGLTTSSDKVEAILKAPIPTDITTLKSFLGLVNFYGKFISNLSTKLHPLHTLLKKHSHWKWGKLQDHCFNQIKKELASSKLLAHYDPDLPMFLACDASSYALGGVISHTYPNGDSRPIAYASRTLTEAEKAYSQLDKEGAAIIFSLKKFHDYLFGRFFTLLCDNKVLVNIFGSKKGIPIYAASRLQRWSVILGTYNYEIKFIKSEKNIADALSRLPLRTKKEENFDYSHIFYLEENLPIDYKKIALYTKKDPVLNIIFGYCLHGWPEKNEISDKFLNFYFKRDQMHLEHGCILWGYRVVVPEKLKSYLLNEIHLSHMGINKCKAMARSYFWWPNIDLDIEKMCKECRTCNSVAMHPPKAPLHPWPYENKPWSRLHLDFMGPIYGNKYLIVIDSFSKWPAVFKANRSDAKNVIKMLTHLFSIFGLPTKVVSDNGPPFTSFDFQQYLRLNGIRQLFSTPKHAQSNGQAENSVKIFKIALKKAMFDKKDPDLFLEQFLFDYRNTPHCVTGVSPAQSMFQRNLRNKLDLIRPDSKKIIQENIEKQKESFGGTSREFNIGDNVFFKDYKNPGNSTWSEGKVIGQEGSVIFDIKSKEGREYRRHSNQLRRSILKNTITSYGTLPISSDNSTLHNTESEAIFSEDIAKKMPLQLDTNSTSSTITPRYNLRSQKKITKSDSEDLNDN